MTDGDVLLKARVEDAVRLSGKGAKFVGFLDVSEVEQVKMYLKHNKTASYSLWGGYEGAERAILSVYQEYQGPPEPPIIPITFLFREEDALTHRDFLGALMAGGVVRASLGDILIEPGRAVAFVKSELASYFLQEITKIGRVGVSSFQGIDLPLPAAHTFEELSGVIASDRLDCLVAFLARTSREKGCALIAIGSVFVNHKEVKLVSHKIKETDTISIRSIGKFIIDQLGPVTKKGRLALRCRKYR